MLGSSSTTATVPDGRSNFLPHFSQYENAQLAG
jgi:hypothetical protein